MLTLVKEGRRRRKTKKIIILQLWVLECDQIQITCNYLVLGLFQELVMLLMIPKKHLISSTK